MCIDTEVHRMSADGSVWIIHNINIITHPNGGEEDRVPLVAQFWIAICPYLNNL